MTRFLSAILGRLPIGWLQLTHNRTRLVAAVGGVTFANVLIFMQLGFMNALFESSVMIHRMFDADLIVASSDFRAMREANPVPRRRLYQLLATPGVQDATAVYTATVNWTDPATGDTSNFRVLGVDPVVPVFANSRWQDLLRELQSENTALVDTRTREFNTNISDVIETAGVYEIEVSGKRLDLVGTFQLGASFDVDGALIVSDQTFLRLFPRMAAGTPTFVLARCTGGADAHLVAEEFNKQLAEQDALAFTKNGLIAAEQRYQAQQTPVGFVFGLGVALGLIVGIVIVYQVLSTDVQDHMAEYATLKAIGYSPAFFRSLILEEAVCLAALGFVPGMSISLALYALAARATALPISMPISRAVLVFVLTAAMCTVSGLIATGRLESADPAELF